MPVRLLIPYAGQPAYTVYSGPGEGIMRGAGYADDNLDKASNYVPTVPGQAYKVFAASFSLSQSVGSNIASFSDPFSGFGRGTTVYSTSGSVPGQLAVSGRFVQVGATPGAVGSIYPITVIATSGDGVLSTAPVTFNFMATAAVGNSTPPVSTYFLTQPTISPTSGAPNATFTATPGTVANGSITSRAWLLNGTSISTGLTAVPTAAGTLTYQETATGSGTAVSSVISATVSAAAPTLGVLTLSPTTAVVGSAYNGTVTGATSGSTITLSGAGAAGLSISGTTVTGTPTTAGAVNLIETLSGASNSPRTSSGVLTVSATVTLATLTLSSTAFSTGGQTSVGINGKTSGSSITATSSDGTALTVSGTTLTGTFTTAGSPTITLVETLAGATGSPKTSTVPVTVTASGPSVYVGQVANNARILTSVNNSANNFNSRTGHVVTDNLSRIKFVFANWYWIFGTGDVNPGYSQTYTAAVEYPVGTFTQVTFNGGSVSGTTATTDDSITTDWCNITIPSGATIYLRVFMTTSTGWVASSRETSPGVVYPAAFASMEYSTTTTDKTMGGTIGQTNTGNCFFPLAILGETTKPSVLICGSDSIGRGANDQYDTTTFNHGFLEIAVGNKFGVLNAGSYGDSAQNFVTAGHSSRRQALKQYCSHVFSQDGCNDVPSRSATQITADLNTIMGYFSDKRVYRTTITPRSTAPQSVSSLTSSGTTVTATTAAAHNLSNGMSVVISGATPSTYNGTFAVTVVDSTHFTYTASSTPASSPATGTVTFSDQWATAANQSVAANYAVGGTVDQVNANIRAGLNGSLGVFDGLSAWFDSNNKWLTDGTPLKYTADGTHPSPYSSPLRASAISAAVQAINRTGL